MSHRVRILAATLALSLLAAACGSDDADTSTPQSGDGTSTSVTEADGGATDLSAKPAYAEAGPYVAGTTTLTAPDGRAVEVWYPADPGAEEGAEQDVFEITDLLPENLKAIVPAELNPSYPTDAHRDIEASADGPFPIVLFSHGFAAYPTMYQYLTTHLATWGIVVVAPDHRERGLLAALGGARTEVDDVEVLLTARATALAANDDGASLLTGTMDPSMQATAGHSAGTFAAVQAATQDPDIDTFLAMSGGGRLDDGSELPSQPGMVLTGRNDQVAEFDGVAGLYEAMVAPKRFVVFDDAGHNSFNDICLIGADKGGLLEIAGQVGIEVPEDLGRLFLDGCEEGYPPATDVWPATRHLVTAHLRDVWGVDEEPVGLGPDIVEAFEPVAITYETEG